MPTGRLPILETSVERTRHIFPSALHHRLASVIIAAIGIFASHSSQSAPPLPYDFNHDGKPDYLLYNAATHQTAIWYLNNNNFVSGALAPTLPPGWAIAGVADFNLDGNLDYCLTNTATRQTAIWYLSGPTFVRG